MIYTMMTNKYQRKQYSCCIGQVILLFSLVVTLFPAVIGFTCPRLCSCPHEGGVNCSYRNITDISHQTQWDPSTLHINLQGNQIETLDFTMLSPFREMALRSLDVSSNPLKVISIHDQSTISIYNLIMNNCSLETLPAILFQGNSGTSLKVLHVSDNNQPLLLEENLLMDTNLLDVVLERNGLISTEWTERAIIGSLSLNGNPIGDKVWDIGLHISRLTYLYLNDIGLTKLILTNKINGLEFLSVANNQITQINTMNLLHAESLRSLNLRNNSLTSIPEDFSSKLLSLETLNLGANKLTIFKPTWIQDSIITHLYLDHNFIQTITFGPESATRSLNNLEFLILTKNELHCNCELKLFVNWMVSREQDDTQVTNYI